MAFLFVVDKHGSCFAYSQVIQTILELCAGGLVASINGEPVVHALL
jgi:hypothetical protein